MIFKNCEIYFLKADPERPVVLNTNEDGSKRTGWEVELRTTDKAVAAKWRKEYRGGKLVKAVREDKDDDESPIKFYRWKLRRNAFKANGDASNPIEVVRGDTGEPMDPRIIGNGSVADVRVYQRDYDTEAGPAVAHYLMGLSLRKLVKYTPKPKEEFETVERMEVVDDDGEPRNFGDEDQQEKDSGVKVKSKGKSKLKNDDLDDEIPFD